MGTLTLIGLGLYDELDISLKGVKVAKKADTVYIELYTSLMRGLSLDRLQKILGRTINVVNRRVLEEENGEILLREAERGSVVLFVPGDPLIATTHVDLRIRAEKRGIKTQVIHAASIISAAIGLSGLQNYKFGRSVTIPFPEPSFIYETPYMVIYENKKRNLHTLCFLDIKSEEDRFMTVREGLDALLNVEEKKGLGAVTSSNIAVGIARAGSEKPVVKSDFIEKLKNFNFGSPPHTIIFPAEKLHFIEAEALITLAGAPEAVRRMVK